MWYVKDTFGNVGEEPQTGPCWYRVPHVISKQVFSAYEIFLYTLAQAELEELTR